MTIENRVDIRLLDRQFQIKCSAETRRGLEQAAQYLDQRMRKISDGAPMVSVERIAVITALNIVYDLLFAEDRNQQLSEEVINRIESMHQRIDRALYTEVEA
ncbi:MAG: cell division protein ZapA [Gammaproteobacteria bacterium]|nr:cell division protein ZapA [Gammaproteobacteria bacterium]MCP4474206.1 cell division protein ZapA [Gammaproteobacteria bacterium]